jgi:hypothetical protein
MASIKKSVRLSESTAKVLGNIALPPAGNYSSAINSMAEQYCALLEAATPTLSQAEWHAFYCAYNGYMPPPNALQEADMLPWQISEGYQYDSQITEFLGAPAQAAAFVERVKAWSTAERLAVIYKAKAYWQANTPLALDDDE